MKFDFSKSPEDLQNKFQYIYSRLDLQLKILRYNNELLLKLVKSNKTVTGLQKQVDDYFGSDEEHFPEETSPQTEQDEQ